MSDVQFSNHVSPSLHPETASKWINYPNRAVAEAGIATRNAFEGAYTRLAAVETEVATIKANPDLSLTARERLIGEARQRASAEVAERINKLVERVDRTVTVLREKLAAATTVKEPSVSPAEIRAHVKALPTVEARLSFLSDAAARGDREAVSALMTGGRYLAGLESVDNESWARLTEHVLGKLDPVAYDDLQMAQRLAAIVRNGRTTVG